MPKYEGAVLIIYRETPTDALVSWQDASVLRKKDLTVFETQILHISEETQDKVQDSALALDTITDTWDCRMHRMKNLLDPVDSLDAVNKRYLETLKINGDAILASARAAAISESNAGLSEVAAKISENAAKSSETAAQLSEGNASAKAVLATNAAALATSEADRAQTEAERAKTYADQTNNEAGYTKAEADALFITSANFVSAIPSWTVGGRPSSPSSGQIGYNSSLAVIERWTGGTWVRISGGRRGDIKMWSGALSDIEPGWVVADGNPRTHPEGGSYSPPNLRDRFILGTGATYAVNDTGGEATHVLTINEMPSHVHAINGTNVASGGSKLRNVITTTGGIYITGTTDTTDGAGSGAAHNNMPPYYALCFLYKI